MSDYKTKKENLSIFFHTQLLKIFPRHVYAAFIVSDIIFRLQINDEFYDFLKEVDTKEKGWIFIKESTLMKKYPCERHMPYNVRKYLLEKNLIDIRENDEDEREYRLNIRNLIKEMNNKNAQLDSLRIQLPKNNGKVELISYEDLCKEAGIINDAENKEEVKVKEVKVKEVKVKPENKPENKSENKIIENKNNSLKDLSKNLFSKIPIDQDLFNDTWNNARGEIEREFKIEESLLTDDQKKKAKNIFLSYLSGPIKGQIESAVIKIDDLKNTVKNHNCFDEKYNSFLDKMNDHDIQESIIKFIKLINTLEGFTK